MKAFEVIGDLDQEQASSSSEEDEWQEIKGHENKKSDQLKKF